MLASSIPFRAEQLVEQQACAGIMIAVDEARLAIDDVLQRRDLERIAALDHQSHLARHEMDHAVFARIEPFPAGLNALRSAARRAADASPERSQAPCASDTSEF